MIVMTSEQQDAFDWIAVEHRDTWNKEPMPFKLPRFRSIRESLVHSGLIVKTTTGRYVPVPDKS